MSKTKYTSDPNAGHLITGFIWLMNILNIQYSNHQIYHLIISISDFLVWYSNAQCIFLPGGCGFLCHPEPVNKNDISRDQLDFVNLKSNLAFLYYEGYNLCNRR